MIGLTVGLLINDVNGEGRADPEMYNEEQRGEIYSTWLKATAIDRLKKRYNKGILYWKERWDMENSNRCAYAMYYLIKIVRMRKP